MLLMSNSCNLPHSSTPLAGVITLQHSTGRCHHTPALHRPVSSHSSTPPAGVITLQHSTGRCHHTPALHQPVSSHSSTPPASVITLQHSTGRCHAVFMHISFRTLLQGRTLILLRVYTYSLLSCCLLSELG